MFQESLATRFLLRERVSAPKIRVFEFEPSAYANPRHRSMHELPLCRGVEQPRVQVLDAAAHHVEIERGLQIGAVHVDRELCKADACATTGRNSTRMQSEPAALWFNGTVEITDYH